MKLSLLALLALAACSGTNIGGITDAGVTKDSGITSPPPVEEPPPPPPPPVVEDAGTKNGIDYHGGPVMSDGSLGVYLIWYGDWRDQTKSLTREFIAGLSGSPYFAINKGYCQADGTCVSGLVDIRGEVDDAWSLGKDTVWEDSSQAAFAIVSHLTASEKFPPNSSATFVVMVGKDQKTWDGACREWCGWHDHFELGANDLKIAVVWDPEACTDSCSAFTPKTPPPNGDVSADSLVSILAHELEEMATDPDLNAWWGPSYVFENADKCAWTFGDMYPTAGDAGAGVANMRLGERDWLVQQNWVNASGGYCGLRAP